MAADTNLTFDILESYLNCRYKAHLRLSGFQSTKTDYETMLIEARQHLQFMAIEKLTGEFGKNAISTGIAVTRFELSKGFPFILDAQLQDGYFHIHFDGLKKVDGPSGLGDFHYLPVLFYESRHIRKTQRLLLEVLALLLSRVQGKAPESGIIYHRSNCTTTVVRFKPGLQVAASLLDGVVRMQGAKAPPKLLLNDHCQVCEFRRQCHAQAVKEDSLSLLRGLGEKGVKKYARKGIFTLTQVAHTFRPRRKGKRSNTRNNHRYHALHAMAIRDKRVYVFGTPNVPSGPVRIYLDVEGVPEEGFVYLIGAVVCDGGDESRHSFWANSKDEECEIFEQFLALASRYNSPIIFCYGSYEKIFISRMRSRVKDTGQIECVLGTLVNVLSIIYAHFYFPTYTNGLKDIGGYVGYAWSDVDASGTNSIVWRQHWDNTKEIEWKNRLIQYNIDDCAALRRVVDFLYLSYSDASEAPTHLLQHEGGSPFEHVEDLDKLAYSRQWGRVKFVQKDFEFVNNCAYFDYQRKKVFVRTSRTLRKNRCKSGLHLNRQLRVSERVEIFPASRCPACGNTDLVKLPKGEWIEGVSLRVKRAFDLVITPSGIRRRVVECRASVYRCTQCGNCFTSERYQRVAKHYHGLMSWSIYQHVAHRTTFKIIEGMFREFFSLIVSAQEIHMFKSLMAQYYAGTYHKILAKIVTGSVLHVDETVVKLKTGKGYVWVFASLEEVVYLYRPTREGDFLKEMLKDFKGVLISDFYAAYDSLDCPQQKCLIHLIRDINQEVLNNPFDDELQSVTQPFGLLLQSIVATIDEHGLKRKFLERHADDVAGFFRMLSVSSFRSEATMALKERLLRHQDKLFTFMQYDGVPWNNNNAENAIKMFAYYRRVTVGRLMETGLVDYLTLLSIQQTCRYKGISFLKFMLSKRRDVDAFCTNKRKLRRHLSIELYPKGFVPPGLNHLRASAPAHQDRHAGSEPMNDRDRLPATPENSGDTPHTPA